MKNWLIILLIIIGMSPFAQAQITRTATFENYVEGQSFKPSFTDPVSGVTFRDSTAAGNGFLFDYTANLFGDGNVLGASGVSPGLSVAYSAFFGFTADLPSSASWVSIDVACPSYENASTIFLKAYRADGTLVGQITGPVHPTIPFTLRINDPDGGFNINTLQVITKIDNDTVYDNLSFMVLPEPTGLTPLLAASLLFARRSSGLGRNHISSIV